MPVILGPDGPSLGGFVCPAAIVHAELWKIGQLKPGDTVRFRAISLEQALAMEERNDRAVRTLTGALAELPDSKREEPVLRKSAEVVYRADGDRYLLVEYGPIVLDFRLRLRVHALEMELRAAPLPGILDITAGVRSLQIHYDARTLRREHLMSVIEECETRIPDVAGMKVPSRVVHLPLSWEDPATLLAIQKYMQSVRPDAPWCPSNIEFIRRINGLESVDDVKRIVFEANYLVLGLGDVYLGAPVATPVDPRHRLVTTKYNPARTWTPENAVGIGGAYLCVYGMEGPGGYQFVGRTVQMWNTYSEPSPWLLRPFDQLRFFPVSAAELLEMRDAFPHGGYSLRVESGSFRLEDHRYDATEFKARQQNAFLEERERWTAAGVDQFIANEDAPSAIDAAVPEGCRAVRSSVTASVWSIGVEAGQRVEAGQKLMVLEAMKMEIAVTAPVAGIVETLNCKPGMLVAAGQVLAAIRAAIGKEGA